MKRYESVDLFADLKELVDANVKHFPSAFDIDKNIFIHGFHEKSPDFIWFIKPNGTGCVNEKEAYIKGTYDFNECMRCLNDPFVNAYLVHMEGRYEDKFVGTILEVDAKKLQKEIMENWVSAEAVHVIPKVGEPVVIPYERYNQEASHFSRKYGEFKKNYILSGEDAQKLASILLAHKKERSKGGLFDER